jgi:LPS export ABC transporter protein LptC
VLEGFSHWVTKEGIRRSEVQADTAYFYENTQLTQLRKVRVVFYDATGQESSTLTARAGTYRWQDGSMQANGDVVVVTPTGRRLRTDTLRYDNGTNTISTNTKFVMDSGSSVLRGNSFRSDPDFKNVVTDQPKGVTQGQQGVLLPGQGNGP